MGRPIKSKFFGNRNYPYDNEQTGGNSGTGGEGVASITVSNTGSLYSQGTSVSIGAPTIAGGIPATISYRINSAGNITVAVVNSGSGYTSAPALTVTTASTRTPTATAVNGNLTLTSVSSVAGIYVGMRLDGSPGVQASTYVASVGTNTVTLTKTMTASTTTGYAFSDVGSGFSETPVLFVGARQNAISFKAYLLAKDGGATAITGGDTLNKKHHVVT